MFLGKRNDVGWMTLPGFQQLRLFGLWITRETFFDATSLGSKEFKFLITARWTVWYNQTRLV